MNKRAEVTRDEGQFNKYYHVLPNMYDDDLDPYEYRLIGHYKRVGTSWEGTRKIAKTCQMSVGKVSSARKSLEEKGLIRVEMLTRAELKERGLVNDPKPEAKTKICVTSVVDVSEQNYNRYRDGKQPVHYANTDPVHHMNTPVHGMNTPVHHMNERNNTVEEITIEEKDSAAPKIDAAVSADSSMQNLHNASESAQPPTATPSEQKSVLTFSHSDDGEKAKEPPSVPRVSPTPRKQKPVFNAFTECAYGIQSGTRVPKETAVHINKLVKVAEDAFESVFKSSDPEKIANAVRLFYREHYPPSGKLTPVQKIPSFGAQFLAFIQTYRKPKAESERYSMPELPPVYQWSDEEIAQRKADLEALKKGIVPERKSA